LSFQFDWRGAMLQNLYILVCDSCLDIPQEQLRAITLPADPVPIVYARPELYSADSIDYIGIYPSTPDPQTGIPVVNQNVLGTDNTNDALMIQPLGPNATVNPQGLLNPGIGLDAKAQMAFVFDQHWAQPVPVLSMVATDGTTILNVTCSAPHGLATGAQIAVDGVTNPQAWGFFNIIVVSPVRFSYATNAPMRGGSVMDSGTRVITANAGIPWGPTAIPKVGL
jgi:hypothetical protein